MTDDGLTRDAWLGGRLRLLQPAKGYRVAIDAALLAAATPLQPGGRALELGTGVGAAALALAARVEDAAVTAVELQPDLAALARRNVEENGFGERVDIRVGDVSALGPDLQGFDAVCFNPPYLKPEENDAASDPAKRIATVEGPGGLPAWVAAAAMAARPGGDIVLIHRADRLVDILAALAATQVGGLTVFPLWPKCGAPAKRILVHGRKHRGGRLTLAAGLTLHRADGGFTPEAAAALAGGALDLAATA